MKKTAGAVFFAMVFNNVSDVSEKSDAFAFAFSAHVVGPYRRLYFADVAFAQKQHTQSGLTYASADRERKSAVGQSLVERQRQPVRRVFCFKLFYQRISVYADTHRREFESSVQNGIIQHEIAVQRPVVVIGSPAVVFFSAFQPAAYLSQEHGAALLNESGLAFGRSKVGISVFEFLRRNESDFGGQFAAALSVIFGQQFGAFFESVVYRLYRGAQIVRVALLTGDDFSQSHWSTYIECSSSQISSRRIAFISV